MALDLYILAGAASAADLGAFEHHVLQVSGKDKDQALQSAINALQSARFRIDTLDESNR